LDLARALSVVFAVLLLNTKIIEPDNDSVPLLTAQGKY